MTSAWLIARSARPFTGWAAESVRRMKYHGERGRAEYLAALMAPLLTDLGDFDAIVPVPLHLDKARDRGFNQAELLGRELSRASGIPLQPLLIRTRATISQVGLSRDARQQNLLGAFSVADDARIPVGGRYLLVDDVRTTGSTMNECVRTLVLAGAAPVGAITFAIDL
jgi:ComF family protein